MSRQVDVTEAARILGISQDAVRKRIQRGQLASYKVDGRIFVDLDAGQDKSKTAPETHDDAPGGAFVSSLKEQVAFLRDELQRRNDEITRQQQIIAALTQRIPALPAGRTEDQAAAPAQKTSLWGWITGRDRSGKGPDTAS